MIGLARLAVCSTLLCVCSPFALADSVGVSGNVSFTPDSLTFAPPFTSQADDGIFSRFAGGTVNYMLGTVNYTLGIPATELAFTITDGTGNMLAFYDQVNSPTTSHDASGNLDVLLDETGYYTFNGGTEYAGFFNVAFNGTSSTGAAGNVAFLGTGGLDSAIADPLAPVGETPEPTSILLMGTGLLLMAGLLRRTSRWSPARIKR